MRACHLARVANILTDIVNTATKQNIFPTPTPDTSKNTTPTPRGILILYSDWLSERGVIDGCHPKLGGMKVRFSTVLTRGSLRSLLYSSLVGALRRILVLR